MRSRGLVVAIAVVLAVLAAVGVMVYTNQVRTEVTEQDTVAVVVANQDIPANTNLDPLVAEGVFDFVRVPRMRSSRAPSRPRTSCRAKRRSRRSSLASRSPRRGCHLVPET